MVETSGHVDEHGNEIEVHGFRWEPGYEITLLYPWAECGWLQELKTAWESGDQSKMDSALDMLELLLRDFSNFDPYDHDRWKGWINEARLGDPAQLMVFASACAEQVSPSAESSALKFLPQLANTADLPVGCSTAYAALETLYD